MSKPIHISERQTMYSLRQYKCFPLLSDTGQQISDTMYFTVEKPFVLLHAFIADKTLSTDRENDLDQGISNSLLFLENHPVVQVINVADISSFHISPNRYFVEDIRKDKTKDEQFVFVLLCTNF